VLALANASARQPAMTLMDFVVLFINLLVRVFVIF